MCKLSHVAGKVLKKRALSTFLLFERMKLDSVTITPHHQSQDNGRQLKKFIFYLGIGALFTHELDAMSNHEWRVLPLLRMLPDEVGMNVFVAAHVPLFAGLIALVASSNIRTRVMSRLLICGFLVIHGLLHAFFMSHPSYEFSSALSNTLIFGGAVMGGLYIALDIRAGNETVA